jgi:SAM-dependent methyltransferase
LDDWRYRELYELEDRHWWFRGRRAAIWALIERAGVDSAPHLLDAGCGTGRNLVEFGRLGEAEGIDFSEQAVEFCHQRGLTGVRQGPVETLPFDSDRFDLILATDVIEHLRDDVVALTELRRVAARGGRIVITVPAYQWLWSQHDVSLHHYRRYTTPRLRRAAVAAGWQPVLSTYFFTAMLPLVAATRIGRGLLGRHESSDLALSRAAVSQVLEAPIRGEAALIRRGARLPFGVSLGMVCAAR